MAEARTDLVRRYELKLKLVEAEAVGRTKALRSGLDEAERCEKAAADTLSSVQAELASARAELFSFSSDLGVNRREEGEETVNTWQTDACQDNKRC